MIKKFFDDIQGWFENYNKTVHQNGIKIWEGSILDLFIIVALVGGILRIGGIKIGNKLLLGSILGYLIVRVVLA